MILLLCLAALVAPARLDLDHTDLTPRHRIKDPSYMLDRFPLGELPTDFVHCKRSAKCVRMSNATCMGTRLPYDTTTLDLFPGYITQTMIREKLQVLQGLKHIPKCWAVVQPFLCSVFMPKCVNDTVDLPSQEMCKIVSSPCRILFNQTIWPNFIKCENTELFPSLCKNDIREIKFNTTWKCLSPLVPTDNALAVFEGVEGCGTPCDDPLYTSDEKKQIHSFIFWAAGICILFNLFTVVTFLINWRGSNKYPPIAIFYINCCFLISCIGWLSQFLSGNREVIVCKKDGTLRMSEPSGENLSCVIIFVLIYYSLMAAMVWFVIFAYTWYMKIKVKLGKLRDTIEKKGAYFHLLAWCLPLMLTVTIMALGEIDGNYVTGICFVGYNNHVVRAWFVLGPVIVILLVGGYFLSRGLVELILLKITSQEIITEIVSSKIRGNIVRMGLFTVFTFVAVVVTFYCHLYDFGNSWKWKQSFHDYVICSITTKYAEESECKMKYRPSAAKLQLHLLAIFFAGILMSFCIWTRQTIDIWTRFLKRTFNRETEEPVKLKKHKVIAQVFAKRKMFNHDGRLSISFHNSHEDPVGLNLDLNSVASQDFSSTWAAALPKLVMRRCALVGSSVSSNRRNSTDSQYSFSVRRVSVESRRNSCDSQFAVSFSEVKAELKTSRVNKNSNKRRKKTPERTRKRSESHRRGRRDYEKSRSNKIIPALRRGSTTSQESQLNIQILSALKIEASSNNVPLQVPNMKRRAGLDEETIKDAERLMIPFFFSRQSDTEDNSSSEEKANGKDIDLEAVIVDAHDNDSDNIDSQADEDTKMLEGEDIRNAAKYQTERLPVENETVLKHLLPKSSDPKAKTSEERAKKSLKGDLKSSLSSYTADLTKFMQINKQSNDKEKIATQTLPLEVLEMEALKQSIDEIINSRNSGSRGTQISPQTKKCKKQPK